MEEMPPAGSEEGLVQQAQEEESQSRPTPERLPLLLSQKPVFRVLDPPDPGDLVYHPHRKIFPANSREAYTLDYGWNIICASRRGDSHAHHGKYREDDFSVRYICADPQSHMARGVLVALADGVSSSAYSRRGARAAALGATEDIPEEMLTRLIHAVRQGQTLDVFVTSIFAQMRETARQAVVKQAEQDQLSLSDLYSTLLAFLAIPTGYESLVLASAQIGDGALYAFRAQEYEGERPRDLWRVLQKQQIQENGNEVQPFMYSSANAWIQSLQYSPHLQTTFIMAMTDGTADDLQPAFPTHDTPDPDPCFFVHQFYKEIARQTFSRAGAAQALEEFLQYEQAQSRDDRTVVCLFTDYPHTSGIHLL